MRMVATSLALGIAALIVLMIAVHFWHKPALVQLIFQPGMLLGPLVLRLLPEHWAAGNNGDDGPPLFAGAVTLTALVVWWIFLSVIFFLWFRLRARIQAHA